MTLARLAAALIAVALPVLAPQQTPPSAPGQQPRATFRAVADIVPVHVSVRTDRSFVRNLTASDFELYDNGVRQDIRAVAADSLAVDVTLVVDTSGSVVRSIGRFKSDVRDIVRQLRPDEQVRLITFDSELREIFPMQGASNRVPVDEIRTGDLTSLLDAMLFALARAPRPDRRHLVLVFTDGYDNASLIGYRAIADLASRAEATLYVVLVKMAGAPANRPAELATLSEAAARTGGTFFPPTDAARDIPAAFKQTLEAFRHGYVLYFTPANVPSEGWHNLTVRVTKTGVYDVRARQGYFGG
ncbi:MAG TPA: VWA domain-containing protein [Vicinamibacterales bacterium]